MEQRVYYKVIHETCTSRFNTIEEAFHEAMKLHDAGISFSIIMVEETVMLNG